MILRTVVLGLALALGGSVRAAPQQNTVTILPGKEPRLAALAAALAQRCPGGRRQELAALDPLLPRTPQGTLALGETPRALFLRQEDPAQAGVELLRLARALEDDPAALLLTPQRRVQLREAYLFAARALLQAGDGVGARAALRQVLARFGGPPPSSEEWGPAVHEAAAALRAAPPALEPLWIDGPAGVAVHIDEQPVGSPPLLQHLPAGRHAVVAIAPDGARRAFALELPLQGGAARLWVGAPPPALCSVDGETTASLCSPRAPAPGPGDQRWDALAFLMDGDLLLLWLEAPEIVGATRLHRGARPPARVRAPLADAATMLTRDLCAPGATAPRATSVLTRRLAPRWPAGLVLGAGLALVIAGAPLQALHGRCVGGDCARVYDFGWLAPSLLATGVGATLAGGLWLGLSLRARPADVGGAP